MASLVFLHSFDGKISIYEVSSAWVIPNRDSSTKTQNNFLLFFPSHVDCKESFVKPYCNTTRLHFELKKYVWKYLNNEILPQLDFYQAESMQIVRRERRDEPSAATEDSWSQKC